MEFSSIAELYARLEPALIAKVADLYRNGIDYIKKEDIWNYLKIKKWQNASNLLLYQMVDDILNTDNVLIDNYVKDNLKKNTIKPNLEIEG